MDAIRLSQPITPQTKIKRLLWRRLLQWRFRFFQRHRYDRMVLEEVAGKPILVLPQVFNPGLFDTSQLLVRTLNARLIPPGSTVLDMGTGSGIGAVFAAQWARRVVAVDINPAAARCARINALLNQVDDRVEAHQGDLFAPVQGQQFDVVLFNPPFYRGAPRGALDHAWRSTDVVERFAADLRSHLTPNGHALVVLSTDGETDAFLRAFRANHFDIEVVARRDLINETVTIYRLSAMGR
ncbi:MAG: HemK2/MTQ2 family protein methyltransferase [Anaerolineae bacterium]